MYIRPEQIGPGANLFDRDLRGADLSNKNLAGADMTKADLTGADLRYALVVGAYLDWAKLDNAKMVGVVMVGANCNFASCRNADLSFSNLAGANFTRADLRGANIKGALTKGCKMTNANLVDIKGYGKSIEVFLELVRQFNLQLTAQDWQIIGHVVGQGWCWEDIAKMCKEPPSVLVRLAREGYGEFMEYFEKYAGDR